jgi:hypothetical protein
VKCPFLPGDIDVRISNANSGINSSYIPLNKHKTDVLGNIFKDSLSEIIEKALVQ